MLVYMIVTMVIFFSLFAGLRNISTSQINYEYYTLEQTYLASYNDAINEQTAEDATITAQNEVATKYDEIKENFLTIKNIWRPDNWSTVFPTSAEYLKSTNTVFKVYEYQTGGVTIKYVYLSTNAKELTDANETKYVEPYVDLEGNVYLVKNTADDATNPTQVAIGDKTYNNVIYPEIDEKNTNYFDATTSGAKTQFLTDFDVVTAGIQANYKGQWNGYLILVVMAGAITFLSSWFSNLGLKTKDAKGNEVKGAKPKPTMGIILAFVMVFFTISYTSAFAIYIITNSLVAMLLNFVTNIILNKLEERKNKKEKEIVTPDYVRK